MQLARALAVKHGRPEREVDGWRSLLAYTQGNPLTITVVVGQALRDGLKTPQQIEAYVARLRNGEAAFQDEVSEGRSRSLGASLGYGFEHAFTENERKQLALLHFFQGFVDVDALRWMGNPDADWGLLTVRGLTREAGIALLDRAAEVGLLTAYGGGYYDIHPALPWYFKTLFDQYYPALPHDNNPALQATRAFVEAMGELGNYYHNQYGNGNHLVIAILEAEEANLLQVWWLARSHGWWRATTSVMQGLHMLYAHTGRRAEWVRLVEEIVPDFVDPTSGGPVSGRETEWSLVTEYRVRLARQARQWAEAERLQKVCVEWDRQRATSALTITPESLDRTQHNTIRTLAVSLHQLGDIRRELGQIDCFVAYEESLGLLQQIGDQAGAANCAASLGLVYKNIPSLRDLVQAENWYKRSLELRNEHDSLGLGKCLNQLGSIAYERFLEARRANQSKEELLRHLNAAVDYYQQALKLLPSNAVDDLAVTHNALGVIYGVAGDLDQASPHYREAIRYFEQAGAIYNAATTRFNLALDLWKTKRFEEALLYARAALKNFETYGDQAAEMIQRTQGLIADIEQAKQNPSG